VSVALVGEHGERHRFARLHVVQHREVVGVEGVLGRPGLGVDADHTTQQPLGGGHVDVPRTGDQIDRVNWVDRVNGAGRGFPGDSVGEHRD
jgi:hypothetical protein